MRKNSMRFIIKLESMIMMIMFAVGLMAARADTQLWSTPTGDWSIVDNWTNTTDPGNTRVPAAGDDVLVTNAAALVFLTNSTEWLSSLIISNATVSCSNWDTTIYVTNLTILESGVLTCAGPFTNEVMSNRVCLTCTTLVIGVNGAINVQGKGYIGGKNNYGPGSGPGAGYYGAAHGGRGGGPGMLLSTQLVYDSVVSPLYPGSGGRAGSTATGGGNGGGAVCLTAVQVVVNGSINADAKQHSTDGRECGGSGGSVYITCSTITGTNGTITADGGGLRGFFASSIPGGGGGGGCIAVLYDEIAQNLLPVPSITFSAAAGRGGVYTNAADIGTLYFPDNYFFSPTNLFNGQWLAPEPVNVALSDWTVSNVWTRLCASGITVTNMLTVTGTNFVLCKLEVTNTAVINCGQIRLSGASLVLGIGHDFYVRPSGPSDNYYLNLTTSGPTLNCSGDLTLISTSRFYVSAGLTNSGAEAGYGARVIVGGDVTLSSNSWISPAAHSTNGAVVLFRMRNLTINSGGFDANYLGYGGGRRLGNAAANVAYGPGISTNTSAGNASANAGSSYGGMGSNANYGQAAPIYGSSNAPVDPGSGARAGWASGSDNGPYGGGSVQIRAMDKVAIQGTIMANGGNGGFSFGPGASGGGIYIACRTFIGDSNGSLLANGGHGCYTNGTTTGGGGGGGRIAVWRIFDNSSTVISNYVYGGVGYNADTSAPGTIVWGSLLPPNGTIVTIY